VTLSRERYRGTLQSQ